MADFDTDELADMPLSTLRQRYLAGVIDEEDFDRALEEKAQRMAGPDGG